MNVAFDSKSSDIPDVLRWLCLAQSECYSQYHCLKPILEYLIDHISHMHGYYSPFDYVFWTDYVFETCLIPVELHTDEWREYSKEILKVITKSGELLQRLAPINHEETEPPWNKGSEAEIVRLSQKNIIYSCILYTFTEEWDALKRSLEAVLKNTERNVLKLVELREADEYVRWDDHAIYHAPEVDIIEPINWLTREDLGNDYAQLIVAKLFERYIIFLYRLSCRMPSSNAAVHLYTNAEERLRNSVHSALVRVEDELREAEITDICLFSIKEDYMKILHNSKKRTKQPF